jgi:hypothetical protein
MRRTWITSTAVALPLLGVSLALFAGSEGGLPCAEPQGTNCQVFSTAGAYNSSGGSGFVSADDFTPASGGSITAICFWGAYVPDPEADPPADDFTVTYYQDSGSGFPGSLIAQHRQASGDLSVTGPVDTGEVTGGGTVRIWEYSATHPGVSVSAGQCYWIEISNPNDGTGASEWYWSWALDDEGNAWSMVDGTPPDGYGFSDVRQGTDLAFCLSLALGDPANACGVPAECGPGAGPCNEPNATPGCEDPGCCALVCEALPLCCSSLWFQGCVDVAEDLNCLVSLPQPCEPPLNCHTADLGSHGGLAGDAFIAGGADHAAGFITADNFTPAASGVIDSLCWWGFYYDFGAGVDCSPGPGDDFSVTYYEDDGAGLPGTVIAARAVTPAVTANGGFFGGSLPVFRFDATHADVAVSSGVCYWIEIANNLDGTCVWFWNTAPPGDGYAVQDQGDGYDVADGENWDVAWCINLPLADDAPCAPPTPNETCDAGDVELTQSTDPDTITADNSAVCVSGGVPDLFGRESGYARSYDLSAIPETAGFDLSVQCVQFGVEINQGGAYTVSVNIYEDTDGGPPTAPGVDLVLLGAAEAPSRHWAMSPRRSIRLSTWPPIQEWSSSSTCRTATPPRAATRVG